MPFQLIYRSRVARKVRFSDVQAIADAAAENNAKSSISGLLLYTPAYFLQVLEGDKRTVEATFARIATDKRHEDVVTLVATEVEERQFDAWGMRAVMPRQEVSATALGQMSGDAARELLMNSR